MVKVPSVRGPRPAAYINSRCEAYVFKLAISLISIQRIAACVPAIKRADSLRVFFMKMFLLGNSHASRGPHVRNVHVLVAVVVEIKPARAHPCPDVLDARFRGYHGEFSVAIVTVKIVSPEVVGHIQVWRAVGVVVAPGARETIAVVVRVQSRRLRTILKSCVAFVVKQEVRRPIACIEIRSRIVILVQTQVVGVEAKINIKTSIAVVVSRGSVRERSLRRPRKLEGIAFQRKLSVPLIQKEQRPAATNHQKILEPFVLKISEKRASRAIQHADSRLLRHILKRSIPLIVIETVRKSRRLADVQVVESVVVNISGRQAVVAVNVDAAGPIQNGAPVINSVKHLLFVRFRLAQRLGSNVNKYRFAPA